ncbi:MAG: class B sortase, partial [Oscillospiraceae bacterium]|nr:class B sortase [Oscillospiraceae bacterium]
EKEMVEEHPNTNFPDGFNTKYAAVYAQNPDTAGWIKIPNSNIDYPVMLVNDDKRNGNAYYLTKGFNGEDTKYGTPFFDTKTRLEPGNMSKNLVIYGHNSRYSQVLFNHLVRYENQSRWQQQPIIEMDTIYGNYLWLIYGVFYTNGEKHKDDSYIFPYYWTDMEDGAKFLNYIAEVDRRRLYDTGVDIRADDTLLTLSTCAYNFPGSRFVVVARKVRPGEDPNIDVSRVLKRRGPQFPDIYYKRKRENNNYAHMPKYQLYA